MRQTGNYAGNGKASNLVQVFDSRSFSVNLFSESFLNEPTAHRCMHRYWCDKGHAAAKDHTKPAALKNDIDFSIMNSSPSQKKGSAIGLEFIMLTCCVRRWFNWLGEITQRWKIAQMSNQSRHRQLRVMFGSQSSDIPDVTHDTWIVLTLSFFFFFFFNRLLSASVSLMSWWMKQRQARRWRSRGAGLRCEQVCGFTAMQEWEQFQVHSCGVWLTLIYTYIYTPSLPACVEMSPWEGRERRAGWGLCVNSILHCHNFEQGTLRNRRVHVWSWGLEGDRGRKCVGKEGESTDLNCTCVGVSDLCIFKKQ